MSGYQYDGPVLDRLELTGVTAKRFTEWVGQWAERATILIALDHTHALAVPLKVPLEIKERAA